MRTQILTLIFAVAWTAFAWSKSIDNVDESGVIIQGHDVVSYFKSGGPKKGDSKYRAEYNGSTYFFSSEKNKHEFLKSPEKYAPKYGGWCAYAVADSESKVEIDPTSYLIQDGKLLLFYNGLWGNTRKKWLKDDKDFLKKADANWPKVKNKEP